MKTQQRRVGAAWMVALGACSSGAPGAPDAAVPTAPDASANVAAQIIATVDATMTPIISANALGDLDRCVGAVVAVTTPVGTFVRGYGATVANGTQVPDGNTLFQVGSISKAFTGLGLASLVEAGTVTLSDEVVSLVAADVAGALEGSDLTVGDLVTHHGGLPMMPSNVLDRDLNGQVDPGADPLSPAGGYARADLVTYFDATPTPLASASYAYSNLGLGLLAITLQDHQGAADADALIRSLVTGPLGMTDTWGTAAAVAPYSARVAQGYALANGQRVEGRIANMGVLAGAGELSTTGNDMARFLAALAGSSSGPLDAVIARALTPLATGPSAETEMGYGVELTGAATSDVQISKGGATPSYTAYLQVRRAPAVGVAVMTSCGGFMQVRTLAETLNDDVSALLR